MSNSTINTSADNLNEYIDPIWEAKYSEGHVERYPWDIVISFIFKYRPKEIPANEAGSEVGFGTGANLWFAAREGFDVSGVEQSKSAIRYAKERFKRHGLTVIFSWVTFEYYHLKVTHLI